MLVETTKLQIPGLYVTSAIFRISTGDIWTLISKHVDITLPTGFVKFTMVSLPIIWLCTVACGYVLALQAPDTRHTRGYHCACRQPNRYMVDAISSHRRAMKSKVIWFHRAYCYNLFVIRFNWPEGSFQWHSSTRDQDTSHNFWS